MAANMSLKFGYSAAEDRIVATWHGAAGAPVRILLTRRMVGQLGPRLAALLDRASASARRAPSDLRAAVLQFEHQSAVARVMPAGGVAGGSVVAPPLAADTPPRQLLAVRVEVTPRTAGVVLRLAEAEPEGEALALQLRWSELHGFLEALWRQVARAQWALPDWARWLAPDSVLGAHSA